MLLLLNEFKYAQSFPIVHIALRIYLSMMTSDCSGERYFSKMKRIMNELRSILGQHRLFLNITENDSVSSLNFTDLINDFAMNKVRKRPM